jgi:hypothetical protein
LNTITKKVHITLILITAVVLFISQFSVVYSDQISTSDDVLGFLEDVINLDVPKYDVEILGCLVNQPDWLGGLTQITGKISLKSESSKLDILYNFINNSLSWCLLNVKEGTPLYTKPLSSNLCDLTIEFLQEYQTHTGDTNLEGMKQMLDVVDVTKNTTKTFGNVKFEVSVNSFSSSCSWKNTFNNTDYSGICVEFKDGHFYSFRDDRSYYKIGGTEVNISEQQAISIALKEVEHVWWSVADEKVTEFSVVEKHIRAELLSRSREPLELYPYWLVNLPLDKIYPGSVYSINVAIWADTSEIIECYTQSFGGDLPPELLAASLPEQGLTDETCSDDIIRSVALVVFVLSIVISLTIIYKKKKSQLNPFSY